MSGALRYLAVFIGLIALVLTVVLLLNLQLGERALGSVEATRAASEWQQQTKGVTYAPPTTNTRPFKVLRLADRLGEINAVVLGSSTGMGITSQILPEPLRIYNFTLTANSTAAIIAEAEYLIRHHPSRLKWMLIGLDWSIGMIYYRHAVTPLTLEPAAMLTPSAMPAIAWHRRVADALALPRVTNLAKALRAVATADSPIAAFRTTFFGMASDPYPCSDGVPARDFDVVNRGKCLGFRYDGSWTFGGEKRLSQAQSAVLARAAAAPSSKFSRFLCMTGGKPNPEFLERLRVVAETRKSAGGETVFYLPPMIPGMEAAFREAAEARKCLDLTLQTLADWAVSNQITIIDAGASERFGCVAGEFLDEHHAYPECHARVFRKFFEDQRAGRVTPGLYRPPSHVS